MKNTSADLDRENSVLIGEKIFVDSDQLAFAQLSGDYNPIHMDELVARRLLAGQKVIHGFHMLLWALEYWLPGNDEAPFGLRCDFKAPVHIGDNVKFFQSTTKNNKSIIRAYANELLCLKIVLLLSRDANKNKVVENPLSGDYLLLEKVDTPCDLPPQTQLGKKYKVAFAVSPDKKIFPCCQSRLGSQAFSAITSLSYFGGMVCPGLHSLISAVDITFYPDANADNYLYYSIDAFDPRFELFSISVSGIIFAELTLFRRPAAVQQTSAKSLLTVVKPDEFINTKSLVIGGSRGLGEYTAKLLATGGGDVIITYSQGSVDAQRVCDEINALHHGVCKTHKFNMLSDPVETLALGDVHGITAVYYFATPKIFRKKAEAFNKDSYNEFYSMYVSCFEKLCDYLENLQNESVTVFLPSSTAVVENRDELAEYAKAKLLAEQLAEKINRTYQRVFVVVSRLPRLQTDQTATISKVAAASTLDTMLPLVRFVSSRSNKV